MSLALPVNLPSSRNAQMLFAAFSLMAVAVMLNGFHRKPRAWRAGEVPVAFWSWRNQTPSDADVREAIEKVGARTIFLRAGQIDLQDGKLTRIRSVNGSLPREVDLHLVYNATRSLLAGLDSVDQKSLAAAISGAFQEDSRRALAEHARVVGLQVDIDFPTRLLDRYARMLRVLRSLLRPGTQLSITGLPTWMQANELRSTLAQCDFWIPQFYGAEIPERADQSIPISSPQDVERFVNKARELNKPFYAGLAAYSYVLLYSRTGSLITLRGDLDPAVIARDSNLELIDLRSFANASGEWRYAYRARADGVIAGLAIHAGEMLVVEAPSAASLRASACIVRELAGEKLLGICVFRLPAVDDPATLTIDQVATALADRTSVPVFKINFTADPTLPRAALVEIENQGTANAIGNVKIDLTVGAAAIDAISVTHGASVSTICRLSTGDKPLDEPCSRNRANLIRISVPGLRSGQTLKAFLFFRNSVHNSLPVSIETRSDDGRTYRSEEQIQLKAE